jgi:uncharacterized protein YbjQ (UPF0145 family)
MLNCHICGETLSNGAVFCNKCGTPVNPNAQRFLLTTTPTVPGYKVTKVIGIVSGITPRTRGLLGKFIGGIQSMIGGEVTAFSYEIEKARAEAIDRCRANAVALGANAVIAIDIETTDLGYQLGVLVFSATGTAVILEPET